MTDFSDFRREYLKEGLSRKDLPEDPLVLFSQWQKQTIEAGVIDPTAMCVATVDQAGQPWQRMVLLKKCNHHGFVFFTNLSSRKAEHLKLNAKISLLFPWNMLERQVAITGVVERLSMAEVIKYFATRPRDSQLAAWASSQSSKLSTRKILETQFKAMQDKFSKGDVPLPDFWGGYCVKPSTIEFWQGGAQRLHDRFLYQKQASENWEITRLSP